MRIGLIGGGFMGEALVSAWLKAGVVQPGDVTVSDVAEPRRKLLASEYGVSVTSENAVAARDANVLVLAVKPQEFSNVAAGLKGKLDGSTVLSIMAGVPMERIGRELGLDAVVRVMPNTAAFVQQAISLWIASAGVPEAQLGGIAALLRAAGRELRVTDEKYLDMATAVSGSGPGFIFLFLEALIDAGVHVGMRRDVASELAIQTLLGSATLAREMNKHPAELRNMVTSPGGTTAAGLQVLEDAGFRGLIIDAIEAAYERSKELRG